MTQAAARPRRVAAIDVARAVAIIGVAANHSIDGMVTAGLVMPGDVLETVNSALYIFRMPALAFLLGLFVPRAVAKRGRSGYIVERASLMLYLYLIWYTLQSAAEAATSGLKNTPRTGDAVWAVWQPFAHLWFLPFLVVTAVALAVLQPWKGTARRVCTGAGLLTVAVLAWGWNPGVIGLTGLSLIAFAAAGSMVGMARLGGLMQRSLVGWLAAGIAASTVFLILLQQDLIPATLSAQAGPGQQILSLMAAVAGTAVLLTVAVALSRIPVICQFLAGVGRRTLPIYLAHVMIVAGVRVALVRAGIDVPGVILTVALLLGVTLPFVAAVFAERRWWAAWLFDLPAPVKRRLRAGPVDEPRAPLRMDEPRAPLRISPAPGLGLDGQPLVQGRRNDVTISE